MVLLTVLAVGLMTLTTVSLRASGQSEAMQVARGNARLALALAIGQLQKTAGSDQKITAPGTIANDDAPRWLTGVWNGKLPTAATPVPDKGGEFLGYLASGSEEGSPSSAESLPDTQGGAELLGEGSLGEQASDNDKVIAKKIGTPAANGNGVGGRYAWAIFDEGTKAKVDIVRRERQDLGNGARQAAMGAAPRFGLEAVENLDGFDWFKETDQGRMFTLPTGDLIDKMPELAAHQHEVTVVSKGLVTDAARGGLRKDLSLLFAGASLPADYANKRIYDDPSVETEASNPYWAQAYEYANLYSKLSGANVKANIPTGYTPVKYDARSRSYKANPQAAKGLVMMPVVAKVQMQFSMVAKDAHGNWSGGVDRNPSTAEDNYMVYMIYSPIVTLYNPYSVPISFDELRIDFKDLPVGFRFYRNGQAQTSSMAHFNQLYVNHPNTSDVAKAFGLNIRSSFSKTKVAPVVMQPGENRVFGESVSGDLSWNSASGTFFDYVNAGGTGLTADLPLAPGYPSQGIGYWIDWLTPQHIRTAADDGQGILPLKLSDTIDVGFGPMKSTATTGPRLSIELNLVQGTTKKRSGTLDLDYVDYNTLRSAMSKGSSTFPNGEERLERPYLGSEMYESPSTPLKNFTRAKAFAQFSFYAKTTLESDTPSKPWVQGGHTTSLVGIDLAKEQMGVHPFEVSFKRLSPSYRFPIDAMNRGKFFTGHSDAYGTRIAPQYEVPLLPVQSLAQLRHAQLCNQGFLPGATYTVGESFASGMIPSGAVSAASTKDYRMLDHAWMANTALWDNYFFSSLSPYAGTVLGTRNLNSVAEKFFKGEEQLLNSRMIPAGNTSPEETVAKLTDTEGYQTSAAHLMIDGAFNVNSTSVAAWTALLASLNQEDVDSYELVDGAATPTTGIQSKVDFPFSRMRRATGAPVEKAGMFQGRHARWTGMRSLEKGQIQNLAENIVEEVRARGPFLSLAEFVNRRPGNDKEKALAGALQTAIDKTDSINARFSEDSKTFGADALTGYTFPEAMQGMNAAGAPGYLTQGDILSALGPVVAVRSDTFRIRTYGEALDPESKVIARAWCEAVVQRLPDFVDSNDAPDTATGALTQINQTFGRRFTVTSFRWLGKDEV
ncbi:hypothetical protein OJ996_18515 [Luteolibacter sp. GHJ8]|uniref:Verru_Chthon cassette protein A n=1 Tax=Luteolibacter rhizosphaerae TaxID=2989719 RepID=A0ABT3G706_9BACT|nr:hypothetical protein [Luteolibacter rhizosphaerae]MCW1915585.1 hypothetical protein [Luteolibacter rhizosphaerae]